MATSLADMLDDQELDNMAYEAAQEGTPGHAVCAAYGMARTKSLQDDLRRRLLEAERGPIEALTRDFQINPNIARVVRLMGVDPVDLMAIAIWSGRATDITCDDRTLMTVYANRPRGRVGASIHLGTDYQAVWEFDEEERGPNDVGTIEIMRHPLPETVMAALAGRPLETVLTHPATDGAGYVIRRARHYRQNNSTWIELAQASEME